LFIIHGGPNSPAFHSEGQAFERLLAANGQKIDWK